MSRGGIWAIVILALSVTIALLTADNYSPYSLVGACKTDACAEGKAAFTVLGVNISQGLIMAIGVISGLTGALAYRIATRGKRYNAGINSN